MAKLIFSSLTCYIICTIDKKHMFRNSIELAFFSFGVLCRRLLLYTNYNQKLLRLVKLLTALMSACIWRSSSTWLIFSCCSSSISRLYCARQRPSWSPLRTSLTMLRFNRSRVIVLFLHKLVNRTVQC